ncbi:hypothetical protein KR009_001138, partial [Drosophila setifemur]
KNFNNQIQDIISDIDINIRAQEKITLLKEQELKLIKKQNELADQIQQQEILAQQLEKQNLFKQQQLEQTADLQLRSQQNHDQTILNPTLSISNINYNVIERKRGFRPSDLYDHSKRQFLLQLSMQLWNNKNESINAKTVDLRKIFTPAADSTEILPKNRKLYASSAFYSSTLHPTVEDQVELARRISHSLSDISNQTSKGQSMYVNRKKRSVKWVHEGSAQENSDSSSTSELTQLEKTPLKLIMNPRGQVSDYNSLKELINVETGLLSPDNCAELITALQLHQGRGAELFAKRRRKADNWVVDETNAGTQCDPSGIPDYQQYQPKPAISPKILPAYSDAGKHRVQLNMHQNQLIEKYSKAGLQVVKSPWEAALETGSASSAFLEKPKDQCGSPAFDSPTFYFQSEANDLAGAVKPLPYDPSIKNQQTSQKYDFSSASQKVYGSSNPQRELAYTPCVAQGWGGHNVELPKDHYRFNETMPSRQNITQFDISNQNIYGENISCVFGENLMDNFNVEVHNRLYKLEQFQKNFLEKHRIKLEIWGPNENVCKSITKNVPFFPKLKNVEPKIELFAYNREQGNNKNPLDEGVNVRELIQSFEQQSLAENNKHSTDQGLYVPKEISLTSYAPPPTQFTIQHQNFLSPGYETAAQPLPTHNLYADRSSTKACAPATKSLSLIPNQQHFSQCSYNKLPQEHTHNGSKVNFNPSPLAFDKLSRYEQSDKPTSPNKQYLSVRTNSLVRNASPTPFGLAFNEQGSKPRSTTTISPSQHNRPTTIPSRCEHLLPFPPSQKNQASYSRGSVQGKQIIYPYTLSSQSNLPYSEF